MEIATWWWRHHTQFWQFEHYHVEGAPTGLGHCPHEQAEVLHGRTDFNYNTRGQKELPKVFYLPKVFSELIRNYLRLLYLPKFFSELIR